MDPTPEQNQTPQGETAIPPFARIAILIAAVASTALAIILTLPDGTTMHRGNIYTVAGLTVAFALSERLIFHIEARSEAVSYTPTEFGVALGLIFLFPLELVIARVVGALVGMIIWRRQPLFKLLFNLAHFALETLIAVAVFQTLRAIHESIVTTWAALLIALLVALISGGILVAVAISQFEGELRARVRSEITSASVFHLPPAVLAALVAVCALLEPWLGVIAVTPAPVVWYMIRSHGALMHRHRDLSNVHDFSRTVGDASDLREIATAASGQIAVSTRAARVTVRIWTADGMPIDASIGAPFARGLLPDTPADDAWAWLLSGRSTVCIDAHDPDSVHLPALHDAGIEHCLVSSIADERGSLGVAMATGREGTTTKFDNDDLDRLSAMVQQLAVVVRKAQLHSQVQHEAAHDRLTGLPNRNYFEGWADETIADGREHAVLLIDLDRFKEINDTFGHHAGDTVLIETAARIQSACGLDDLPSRFGGDEFAVLARNVGAAEAHVFAEKISAALEEPFDVGAATVAIAASVGIAIAPEHGRDADGLLRHADTAMYDAKTRRVRSSIYSDDLQESDSSRLTLLADLRHALKNDDLEVHFQPKINLSTGTVVGAEALVRWNHPNNGWISPDIFVELAERAGLVEDLTRQVLNKSTAAAAQWQRRGWKLDLSVNISAQSLHDERLEPLVIEALQASGLEATSLILEITETTMMGDPDRTLQILNRFTERGIKLSIDDFGTGYSSLSSLRQFPVSELKIDRSFILALLEDLNDDIIVRSTIDLAHNLGLIVVAEGVENQSVQQHLVDLGCDVAQGYGISRPIPHQALLFWLANQLCPRAQAPSPSPYPEPGKTKVS